jgi:D-ribose pyranose/furanose isomerase RbsD
VGLEATFRELNSELCKLYDTLLALRLTVVEDKPLRGEAALIDHFENTILDLMGLLEQSMKRARVAQKAIESAADINNARRALTVCQERFHQIEQQFSMELVSYEKLKDLLGLGTARRGEWHLWAKSVRQGIEQCREPLDAASKAMAACWQEIAERVSTGSVSVQNKNVGQKVISKASDRELVREEFR